MTLRPDELEDEARRQTGLDDFGDGAHREGLERLTASMNEEADLTEVGEMVQQVRLVMLLSSRLRIEETYRNHPEIEQRGGRGPGLRHRTPPHRHHRAEPAGGGRSRSSARCACGSRARPARRRRRRRSTATPASPRPRPDWP